MKLSKRLQKIVSMTPTGYQHIWDCCCDHGLLGSALIHHQSSSQVHFVDIVPQLMSQVSSKLQRFHPQGNWYTHCIDVAALPLCQYQQDITLINATTVSLQSQQLVIIAGVGGDLIAHFIEYIALKHPTLSVDFLVCPVNNAFNLRQKLIELDCRLYQEALVEDNQRFYELLLVTLHPQTPVTATQTKLPQLSAVGDLLWQQTPITIAKRYLNNLLQHYMRLQQGDGTHITKELEAYRKVNLLNDE